MQEIRPPHLDPSCLPVDAGNRQWDPEYIGAWFRSSRCSGGDCVEVQYLASSAFEGPHNADAVLAATKVRVRDSKNPDGPVLTFTADEWDRFITGAKAGDFDHGALT